MRDRRVEDRRALRANLRGVRNPEVPESLDGWSILHRMFSFNRRRYEALDASNCTRIAASAVEFLRPLHDDPESDVGLAQLLGHKADLMVTFYAKSFDALGDAEIAFDRLALRDYLEPHGSYVSILELGLYEATRRIHETLRERALKPHSAEWNEAFDALLHGILSIRGLPAPTRRAWAALFEHYVFGERAAVTDHIPPERRGILSDLSPEQLASLRAHLTERLTR